MPETVDVRKIIAEAVTDGLSAEMAAEMLLEPSRWEKMLFNPTRDLHTLYKQYLRGELGVGELADAVGSIAVASGDMMDLADSVEREYGSDITPGDIPASTEVMARAEPEDEQVEVLQVDSDGDTVKLILDSIQRKWDRDLLARLYGEGEELDEANLYQGGISAEDLRGFEQGRFFNNAADSARKVTDLMTNVEQLYRRRKWDRLAQLYASGGPIDEETAGLAGDVMVLRDVAQAAVRSGYGEYPVGGVASFEPQLQRRAAGEAWEPAFIGQDYLNTVKELYLTMSNAIAGNLTYSDLLQQVQPFAKTGGPIFNMARRDTRGGRFRTPFSYDATNAAKLAQQGAQPPEPGIPYEPTPGDDVDLPDPDQPLPEPGAEQYQDVTDASAMLRQQLGIDQPEPAQEPPVTPEPEPEPAPSAAQRAVTQAITGEPDLGDIFGGEAPPVVDVTGTYSLLLGITPDRAKQFQAYLQSKGQDPEKFAGTLKDAFAVMQQLGLTKGGWRSYARANPEVAKKAQHVLQQHIKSKLGAGEEVMAHDLARKGVQALSSI